MLCLHSKSSILEWPDSSLAPCQEIAWMRIGVGTFAGPSVASACKGILLMHFITQSFARAISALSNLLKRA